MVIAILRISSYQLLDLVVTLGIQDKDSLLHGTKKSKKGMRKGLAGDDALPSAGPLSVKGESYTLTLYGIWLLVSTLSK